MRLMHGYMDRFMGRGTHAVCTEDGKPLEMTAENVDRIVDGWNAHWLSDSGKTHWEGCWRDHYQCAMQRIEELEERNRMEAGSRHCTLCHLSEDEHREWISAASGRVESRSGGVR